MNLNMAKGRLENWRRLLECLDEIEPYYGTRERLFQKPSVFYLLLSGGAHPAAQRPTLPYQISIMSLKYLLP